MDSFAYQAITKKGRSVLRTVGNFQGQGRKERMIFAHLYEVTFTSEDPLILAVHIRDSALQSKGLRIAARLLGTRVSNTAGEQWRAAMPEIRERYRREIILRGAKEGKDFFLLGDS